VGELDDFNYMGANMPDYSNFAKKSDIGKIKLPLNKIQPVPYNYTFKNTPAFDFI
jgi:hypothetical protein